MSLFMQSDAEWIWLPQEKDMVNQYADFRHEFTLNELEELSENEGLLHISVDTEYAVWLNGTFAGFNQYDDYPDHKSFDILDVKRLLVKGKNVLCILGYHQGENSYQYIKGRPGLIYAMRIGNKTIVSGIDTFCRQSPSYKSGDYAKTTLQLSFTFEYNAVNEDNWLSDTYHPDSSWTGADVKHGLKQGISLYMRPVHKLVMGGVINGKVIAQGFFIRSLREEAIPSSSIKPTTAEMMQSDYLSSRVPSEVFRMDCSRNLQIPSTGLNIGEVPDGNTGVYLVIDMKSEEAGLFELEIEGENGVIIEISYGEHLDDLRVRAAVGGRNFAFRYTCGDGLRKFTHYMKRIAGRYIQLHIHGIKRGITLYYAGIRPVKYPLAFRGSFNCSDRLLNEIYRVSARTLELCMHEHYEDTPWREQGMYAMDSKNQALCGYYCFGEYDFAESAFTLFTEDLREDGYFEIAAPAQDRITIPSFSMGWILAIADFVLYSGRLEALEKYFPVVKSMLDRYLEKMETGLMKTPSGKKYWNFYEWADGLNDGWEDGVPCENSEYDRLDAPLNLFLCLSLEAAVKMAGWLEDVESECRYTGFLTGLKKTFHERFWNQEYHAYRTYIGDNCKEHYAELTQALALISGSVPVEYAGMLRKRLSDENNTFVKTTLSYAFFKYEALLQEPGKYGALVFDDIAAKWGHMLYNRSTSFWETIKGADDFDKAGSMCHGWSAIPVYFLQAYFLGIKPLEPGFRLFSARPVNQAAVRASGIVPTPYGDIHVDLAGNKEGMDYNIAFPDVIRKQP